MRRSVERGIVVVTLLSADVAVARHDPPPRPSDGVFDAYQQLRLLARLLRTHLRDDFADRQAARRRMRLVEHLLLATLFANAAHEPARESGERLIQGSALACRACPAGRCA
jgi:hypothetical protein